MYAFIRPKRAKSALAGGIAAATALGFMTSTASADPLFWDPQEANTVNGSNSGDLYDPVYYNDADDTTGNAPVSNADNDSDNTDGSQDDILSIGGGSIVGFDSTSQGANGAGNPVTGTGTFLWMRIGNVLNTDQNVNRLVGSGTFNMNGGTLNFTADAPGPTTGPLQSGFIVGDARGGLANISGGTINSGGAIHVGIGGGGSTGHGELNVSNGAVLNTDDWFRMGNAFPGRDTAIFNMSGAGSQVNISGQTRIGQNNDAQLNVSGGTFSSSGNLWVAHGVNGANSEINVTGGNVIVGGRTIIGQDEAASMTIDGGTFDAGAGLDVANNANADANVTLESGTLTSGGPQGDPLTIIGRGNGTTGTYTQNGGEATFGNDVFIAGPGNASGVANLNDGTTAFDLSLVVGNNGNGSLNVTAGAGVTVTNNLRVGGSNPGQGEVNVSGGSLQANAVRIGDAPGSSGNSMTVAGGTVVTTGAPPQGSFFVGSAGNDNEGSAGTYTQTGGTNNINTALIVAGPQNTTGTANIEGGSLNTINEGFAVGNNPGANGTVNQSGGDVTIATGGTIGDEAGATGLYSISGGTLDLNGTGTEGTDDDDNFVAANGLYVAANPDPDSSPGQGALEITGDDATIDIEGIYSQGAAGTLDVTLDSSGNLTLVDVAREATFADGSTLAFNLDGFSPGANETFDVLTAGDVVDNGLTLDAPAGFFKQVVSGGNGEILQVTNVPEPTSLALMGLGGLALLRRRKRG